MKKVRHWLHIILALLTGGLWLPAYVVIISTTEMYNRGYKAAELDMRSKYARKASHFVPVMQPHHPECQCQVCLVGECGV